MSLTRETAAAFSAASLALRTIDRAEIVLESSEIDNGGHDQWERREREKKQRAFSGLPPKCSSSQSVCVGVQMKM